MTKKYKRNELNDFYNSMMRSCYSPSCYTYQFRGGKGIVVCDEWHDKNIFFDWCHENGWEPGAKIRRIDTTKNFCPENCVIVGGKYEVDYKLTYASCSHEATQKIIESKRKKEEREKEKLIKLEKERQKKDPVYRVGVIYTHMVDRCCNPKSDSYKHYGKRGITVCDEWLGADGKNNFIDWSMKHGYQNGLSIDRIDNFKGYSPENCRWVTKAIQNYNRKTSKLYDYFGTPLTIAQIAKLEDIPFNHLYSRITKRKMPLVDAILDYQMKHGNLKEEYSY